MRVTYRRALGAMSLAVLGTACSAPPATFEEQAHALACAVETSTEAAAFASTGAGLEAAPEPEPAPEPSGSPNPTTMCAKNVTCGAVDCVYNCGWGTHTLPLGPGGGQTDCAGGSGAEVCADRCPATKDFPAPHGAGPMTCTLASTVPSPASVTSCEEEIVPWTNCRKIVHLGARAVAPPLGPRGARPAAPSPTASRPPGTPPRWAGWSPAG